VILLITGLLFWSIAHLMPSIGIGFRKSLLSRLGEGSYNGIAAALIAGGVVLMVFGWRSIIPEPLYIPPDYLLPVTYILMLFSLLLFIASGRPTRIKQLIRHPQLTGMALWSVAHLLQNGDDRSILLFGWLLVWAVLEMVFINRRDGVWVKEGAPTWIVEVQTVVVTLVVYGVVLFAHPFISGKAIM
jgi:uncharacterized membrane protein